MRVQLEVAHLEAPCDLERGVPMVHIIAHEGLRVEADWDGRTLGDLFIYKVKLGTEKDLLPEFWYFGSVPSAKVKCYRFLGGEPKQVSQPNDARSEKGSAAEGKSGRA